jgi:Leucine-rich repeat (LRR) protein
MNNRRNGLYQSQFIRNKSLKGEYRSKQNISVRKNSKLVSQGKSFNIEDLKLLILNFKDINNILLKTELFSKLYNIINFHIKNIAGKIIYNTVDINEKIQLDTVKIIFKSNYLLMFEFLVYCHLTLQYKKNFLNFSINYMNLKDENGKLDDKIDITKFNYRINAEILYFINDNFINKLKILDLSNIIDKVRIDYIIKDELKNNKNITKLNISDNKINSLYFLIQEINSLDYLNELNISKNQIDSKEVVNLVNSLVTQPQFSSFQDNKVKLTILNIGSNKIGDAGANAISELLKRSNLTELDISNNKIGYTGAIAIAKAMEKHLSLTKLDISNNYISNFGVEEIAKALQINTTLKELIIFGNDIFIDGVQFIAKALTLNSSLTKLDISYNSIDDAGAKEIVKALKKNTTLKELIIDGNFISDDLLTKIKEALEHKSKNNNLSENETPNTILKKQENKINKIIELQSRLSRLKTY